MNRIFGVPGISRRKKGDCRRMRLAEWWSFGIDAGKSPIAFPPVVPFCNELWAVNFLSRIGQLSPLPMKWKSNAVLIIFAAALAIVVVGVGAFRMLPEGMRGRRLLNALNGGHTTRARLLIWLGTDPNFQTGHGSAMHYAAATGDVDLMRFLVLHGADVDAPAEFGITPLYLARAKGNASAERFLIAHGANTNLSKITPP
jgi:hypothetical protein